MTVYGHQSPTAGDGRKNNNGGTTGTSGGSNGDRRLRDGALYGMVSAAVTVSWAFAAMGAVAALGAHLLGLDAYASLGPMTAALVAMAVGGRVSPSGDVSVFGMNAASAQGAIGIIPLGLSLIGALVLGWLFVRPLRRLDPPTPAVLLGRVVGAVIGFLVLLGVIAWAGNGTVAVKLSSLTGGAGGLGGLGSGGSGDPLGGLSGLIGDNSAGAPGTGGPSGGGGLGGLVGSVGGLLGDNTQPTVGFRVDLASTLALGLLWLLVVLAIALAASRRCPLPSAWVGLRRTVQPVASALVTVLLGAVLVGAVAGIVVGLTGNGGAHTVGGVLLATPNGVFLAVVLGMAVPLNGKATGPLAQFLPSPVDQLLKDGSGRSITLNSLAGLDGRVWLLPVAVALMLLAVGVAAAVRTPRPVLPQSAARGAAAAALRLGVAMAVVTPVLLVLARVSVNANLSVFGFDAVGAGLSITGNLLLGVVLGLVEGAVFGFLGALLVARFASAKRVSPEVGQSDGRGGPQLRDDYRSQTPQPTPPYGSPPPGPGGPGYGGLPQTPLPGQGPSPAPDNPYRTGAPAQAPRSGQRPVQGPPPGPAQNPPPVPRADPPGRGGTHNPYSGGPAQTPPPPPVPPTGR